jgi:HEAT repeat protein
MLAPPLCCCRCWRDLVGDRAQVVRFAAGNALALVAQRLTAADVDAHIVPIIRTLTRNSLEEEQRIEAARLLHELSPTFGIERCRSFVLPLMRQLSVDKAFAVRKQVVGSLSNLCVALGPDAAGRELLPIFLELSRDRIWDVRRAAAEVMANMATNVPLCRRRRIAAVYERLHADESRWVRIAAQQQLGALIVAMRPDGTATVHNDAADVDDFVAPPAKQQQEADPAEVAAAAAAAGGDAADDKAEAGEDEEDEEDDEIPTDSVRTSQGAFVALLDCHDEMTRGDAEARAVAAFVCPAVLHCAGATYWPSMRDAHAKLAGDVHWKVRLTLAYSLHEIARMIGRDETEAALVKLFEQFLVDIDEIRNAAVSHMGALLEHCAADTRARHERTLSDLQSDPISWRLREMIVEQMPQFVNLYPDRVVARHLAPLLLRGLRDPVDHVRRTAAKGIGPMLDRLAQMKHAAKVVPTLVSTTAGSGLTPLVDDADDDADAAAGDDDVAAATGADAGAGATSKSRKFRTAIEAFLARIESMATDKHFDSRQLFCVVCEYELSCRPRRMFIDRFKPLLQTLSGDRVPLVANAARAALSRDQQQ